MEGIAPGNHGADSAAQVLQRRQRLFDYTMNGLGPRYLQRNAQEYFLENTYTT